MDFTKVHMYGQFTKALIVKDTTIDLVAKGQLCAWMAEMFRVVEELLAAGFLKDGEDVYSILAYIETCSENEQIITNLKQDIEGLNKEIEHLRKLNNNQAKMLLNKP